MNINRNNYEEFFLLYVDNELSAAGRKAVELFVQENPDLQAELLTLQEATLTPVPFVFDKSTLLKAGSTAELQEKLILLGDRELDKNTIAELHQLMNADAAAADEWHLLQQTRLVPDLSVVFPGKQSLYRQETGRVAGMKWWRIAAAAVLLGFGLWGGISMYNNSMATSTDPAAVARTKGAGDKQAGTQTSIAQNNDSDQVDDRTNAGAQTNPSLAVTGPVTNSSDKNGKNKVIPAPAVKDNNLVATTQPVTVEKPTNNLPKSYLDNINKKNSNEIAATSVPPAESINSGTLIAAAKPNEKPNLVNNNDPVTNTYAMHTGNPENVTYVQDEEKSKRTKLGSLLRKVKRVVERTANIKTGEGLQIAGFEIAAK